MRMLAFQVAPGTDLAPRPRWRPRGSRRRCGTARNQAPGGVLVVTDPDGTEIELFPGRRFTEAKPAAGIAPFKLGHVAFIVRGRRAWHTDGAAGAGPP